MSMVFNYYAFGTSDIDDILYNLKDKLSENGWTIDYDKISSEGKLAVHVPDTECYYTIEKNSNYQVLGTGNTTKHFHPYSITGNTGVDSGTWYEPNLATYDDRIDPPSTYFVITNSYCLANSKFCVLILEGYTYVHPDYPYLMYYMFGQLEIPNENLQGNFLWITPAKAYYNHSWYEIGYQPGYQIGIRYKDTFNKPWDTMKAISTNTTLAYDCFWGLRYYTRSYNEGSFPESIYSGYGNPYSNWDSPSYELAPWLEKQPYQFGRLYLRTLIVYHKYEQDGVTYIHPIAETPFYICKYKGIEWHNKTITYNTRKFKVYCMGYKGINYASNFGIAFEVGNL